MVRQTWGNHVMDFIYDNTGKPYALKYDGTTYYYVLNLQGDVISIITHWGESYGTYTYDAWGNVIAQSGSIASLNPIRYRGYYYDSETNLYYLGSRYYDPQVKRFINADGAAFATINPYSNGLTDKNYFAYCDNNPVNRSDQVGELWHIAFGAVVGGLVSGISTAIESTMSGDSLGTTVKKTAISAGIGAVSGALGASGLGRITQGVIGAGLGALESYGHAKVSGNKVNAKTVLIAAVNGLAGGIGGGNGASYGSKYLKYHTGKAIKKVNQNGLRAVVGATKQLWHNTWRWSRNTLWKPTLTGILKGTVANKAAAQLNKHYSVYW